MQVFNDDRKKKPSRANLSLAPLVPASEAQDVFFLEGFPDFPSGALVV